MLRIDLAPLKQGVYHYEFSPDAETIDLDPDQFADIQVMAQLDYQNDRALVLLDASATATLECDRTLKMFDQYVEGTHHILFAPPSFVERMRGEDEEPEEDLQVLNPSDHTIDLTTTVRDTLLLALPVRRVAPGVEDMELQTVYGEATDEGEPAIDPRWEALRKLKAEDDEE